MGCIQAAGWVIVGHVGAQHAVSAVCAGRCSGCCACCLTPLRCMWALATRLSRSTAIVCCVSASCNSSCVYTLGDQDAGSGTQ